ncbi:hypothetical protein [Streptomyces sp. NPDC048172]|uniref:hypothetical protein n=1 Tax=Streptomyces sp. NPDC048172 TaxID=3365505 RepID=UPI0037225DA7
MTAAASPPRTPDKATGGDPHERPPYRPRHRLLVLLIVVLLVAIPGGFLVQAAFVSRDSGKDKERAAAATSLTYERPPKVSQRIYSVPVPPQATRVAFYEANSWEKSTMWVQFRTSPKRLKEFLQEIDNDGPAPKLKKGRVTISEAKAREVGWRLDEPGHRYSGAVYKQEKSEPDLAITVDTTYKTRPRVYVVSTTRF